MVSGLGLILLVALAGAIGAVGFTVYVGNRIMGSLNSRSSPVDPILGVRDQVAIYDSTGLLIPMPEHLKTHEEMVAWMTGEMPKLAKELTRSRF